MATAKESEFQLRRDYAAEYIFNCLEYVLEYKTTNDFSWSFSNIGLQRDFKAKINKSLGLDGAHFEDALLGAGDALGLISGEHQPLLDYLNTHGRELVNVIAVHSQARTAAKKWYQDHPEQLVRREKRGELHEKKQALIKAYEDDADSPLLKIALSNISFQNRLLWPEFSPAVPVQLDVSEQPEKLSAQASESPSPLPALIVQPKVVQHVQPRISAVKFRADCKEIDLYLSKITIEGNKLSKLGKHDAQEIIMGFTKDIRSAMTELHTIKTTMSKKDLDEFKQRCFELIDDVRPKLKKYPDAKHVLKNIAIAIGLLGVGYVIAGVIRRLAKRQFTFCNKNRAVSQFKHMRQEVDSVKMWPVVVSAG